MMRSNNLNAKQRRAAISATVVLTAVVLMFLTGLCLMFKHLTTSYTDSVKMNIIAQKDLESMVQTHEHIQAARQSVTAPSPPQQQIQVDTAATNRQQGAAAPNAAFLAGKPFNVSFLIDNTPSGGQRGEVIIAVDPGLAPLGAQRFGELVEGMFFDHCRFFRVLPNFMGQFGINGNPELHAQWQSRIIQDDPVKASNKRGAVTFAMSGKNTRSTQLFINTARRGNAFLDKEGFSPIGEVVVGMELVDGLYSGYGEGGKGLGEGTNTGGPAQGKIVQGGNQYLNRLYPKLSFISKASFA